MNNYFTFMLGLSLMVPTAINATSKNKVKTAAKLIIGAASTLCASVIIYNIAKTAGRRLANPDYHGSQSIIAITKQIGSIVRHNPLLTTFLMSNIGIAITAGYSAMLDIKSDSQDQIN